MLVSLSFFTNELELHCTVIKGYRFPFSSRDAREYSNLIIPDQEEFGKWHPGRAGTGKSITFFNSAFANCQVPIYLY